MARPPLVQDADVRAIWDADLGALGCLDCGVVHLIPSGWPAPRCLACLSGAVEPQPARLRPEPPELVVSFAPALTTGDLARRFEAWLRGVWLRPPDLQAGRLCTRLRRVYLPMWLVDGTVTGSWSARMGFDYQVESSQERFQEGTGWRSQRLTETRVRWEPRAGQLTRRYDNLAVPALEEAAQATVLAPLGRYELDAAVAYAPAAVADAAVRAPGLLPDQAWPQARAALDRAAAADCQRAAGAQHSDELALQVDYDALNWTQLLLPLYATYYEDDAGQVIPVWVNGQSGQIAGVRRVSLRKGWRLSGAVALVAVLGFLAGALLVALGARALASLVMTVSFLTAVLAALPVLWAWQFNQGQARSQPLTYPGGRKRVT